MQTGGLLGQRGAQLTATGTVPTQALEELEENRPWQARSWIRGARLIHDVFLGSTCGLPFRALLLQGPRRCSKHRKQTLWCPARDQEPPVLLPRNSEGPAPEPVLSPGTEPLHAQGCHRVTLGIKVCKMRAHLSRKPPCPAIQQGLRQSHSHPQTVPARAGAPSQLQDPTGPAWLPTHTLSQTRIPSQFQPRFPRAESQTSHSIKPFIPSAVTQNSPSWCLPGGVPTKEPWGFYPLKSAKASLSLLSPRLLPHLWLCHSPCALCCAQSGPAHSPFPGAPAIPRAQPELPPGTCTEWIPHHTAHHCTS